MDKAQMVNSENKRRIEAVTNALQGVDKRLKSVAQATEQAAKTVTRAAKVTQAVATLLEFDEINRLKEKTVTVSAKTELSKEKTGQTGTYEIDARFRRPGKDVASEFITQFRVGVEQADDGGLFAGESFVSRVAKGIANTLGDAAEWLREHLWNPLQAGWIGLGALAVGLGVKLTTSAGELWSGFRTAWQTGESRVVSIGNSLLNSAQTLWQRFSSGWGTRSVGVVNSLVNGAQTLWQRFASGWGTRAVSVVNTLKNSAASLWEQFKAGWAGRVLSLRLSYDTNVSGIKGAVCKALGLSGWPTISFAARGGVFRSATLTMLGEAGTEAVVPLENNTGWMDVMAQRLGERMGFGGSVTVPVYIGGEKVAEKVVRAINDTTRRTGVSPLYV